MKLRSEQKRRERPEGSNVTGECAMGEASAAVGKRKRRMSGAKLGSGDAQVSKIGEGVSGSRHRDKDGKGKGKREGKRSKEEVDGGKGRNGKGREKGNVAGDGGAGVGVSGLGNDVILRSRCTLHSICALHGRLTPYQRDAILGTVLRPVLEYGEMAMERHLTLALIQAWDRRRKAFRIASREVRFTVFDVVLFTGLPGTGKKVELDREELSTQVGDMVRARMGEWERKEMARRVPRKSREKQRFFKHYVNVMMELCEENAQEDRVGIWLRLYAFIVLSGVLFPRTPYGAAWSLLCYVDDVEGMGQYAWAEAVWQVVVDSIEDTQRKLCRGPLSEVQLNGLCLLIQVWFYEHTTIFFNQDGERYPRLASWRKVDHGGMYDATELLAELQESEVLELLRKNRDMLFGEVKLTIMIEDPREVERRRLLGIDDSDAPSREDLVEALEEVNEGKIPRNRVALRMLAEEMISWPNLETEAPKTKSKSKSLYAKTTDIGIDPEVAAKRLNIDWDSAAEIEDAESADEADVPAAVGYGALYLVTAFPVIIGISVVLILFYNSLQ